MFINSYGQKNEQLFIIQFYNPKTSDFVIKTNIKNIDSLILVINNQELSLQASIDTTKYLNIQKSNNVNSIYKLDGDSLFFNTLDENYLIRSDSNNVIMFKYLEIENNNLSFKIIDNELKIFQYFNESLFNIDFIYNGSLIINNLPHSTSSFKR